MFAQKRGVADFPRGQEQTIEKMGREIYFTTQRIFSHDHQGPNDDHGNNKKTKMKERGRAGLTLNWPGDYWLLPTQKPEKHLDYYSCRKQMNLFCLAHCDKIILVVQKLKVISEM